MRPALKPGLLPLWRDRDTIQIGIHPRRAVALTGMAGAAWLIGLLDGSRNRDQLIATAAQQGVPAELSERVLTILAAAGVLDDFPAGMVRALPPEARTSLAAELATASLARGDSDGGARTLARRLGALIRIYGQGRIATTIAQILLSSGVAAVELQPSSEPAWAGGAGDSEAARSASDRQPAGSTSRSQATSSPRDNQAARSASRSQATSSTGHSQDARSASRSQAASSARDDQAARSAGRSQAASSTHDSAVARASRDRRADGVTSDSLAARASRQSQAAPLGSDRQAAGAASDCGAAGLASDSQAVRPTRRSQAARSARESRAADTASRPGQLPDLAILVGHQAPELPGELVSKRVPHLSVSASEAIGVVGPLVLPGRSACLRCLDLARAERDPAWPLLLAQLAGKRLDPLGCDTVLAATVAAQATSQALAFIDDPPGSVTVNGTLELVLPAWQWRRRSWRPRPDCNCRPASPGARSCPPG
ncbi:MAG TPA: hypothetical protein VGI64_21025 [Streptosporangiaceae bacterium]